MSVENDSDDSENDGTIPTIGGAIVSAANSKPVSALLGPSAKALGDYWGVITQECIEAWKAKRLANRRTHIARVVEVEGRPKAKPTEEQAKFSFEWGENAETADPKLEPELSALWQGLLGDIYKQKPDVEELIEALKKFSNIEARLLLEISDGWFRPVGNSQLYERLKSAGVVRDYSPVVDGLQRNGFLYVAFPIVFLSSLLLLIGIVQPQFGGLASGTVSRLFNGSTISGMGILVIGTVFLSFFTRIGMMRLTQRGMRLKESGMRYRAERN